MIGDSGPAFYLRFLQERFATLQAKLETLVVSLVGHDQNTKLAVAKDFRSALHALRDGLAQRDYPGWMVALERPLRNYTEKPERPESGPELLKALLRVYPDLQSQEWSNVAAGDEGPDLDAIFERYYRESRVPELFAALVRQLTEVVESGAVDRISVLNELNRVIAVLRRNANATYPSATIAWQFTSRLFQNFLWEALSDIPVLSTSVKAVRTTIEELKEEMSHVEEGIQEEVTLQASPSELALRGPEEFPMLGPGVSGTPTD